MLLIKSLVVLISATAALAQGPVNAVASGAIFVGEDTTESPVNSRTMFENPDNHITAVSSVFAFAAELANFQPAEKPAKSLVHTVDTFVEKVSTFPGFITDGFVDQSVRLNGSLIMMEKAIRDTNVDVAHLPLIARSFRELTPGYIQDKSLKKWILSLVVLDKSSDSKVVQFKLARFVLNLATDEHHTVSIPAQDARLTIANFRVNGGVLVANAEKFSRTISNVVSPRDMIDLLSSPKIIEDVSARGWEFLKEKSFEEAHNWQLVFNWKN